MSLSSNTLTRRMRRAQVCPHLLDIFIDMPALFICSLCSVLLCHLDMDSFEFPAAGIRQFLDQKLMRYSSELSGVVVLYDNVKLRSSDGAIAGDSPYIHFYVDVCFTVFCPSVGSLLIGKVLFFHLHYSLCAPISWYSIPRERECFSRLCQ